jgi:hypothetical protein
MAKKKPEMRKPWDLVQVDVTSITDKEFVTGTARLLPPVDEIPKAFWDGNIYTRIVEAMYTGDPIPPGQIDFNPGFVNDGASLSRMVMAHIRDMHGDYDHRMAGIGLMISKVIHVTAILKP